MDWKEFLKSKGISDEDLAKKTPQEMAELHSEFTAKNIADLKESIGKSANQEDIDKAVKAFEDAQEKTLEGFVPSKDFDTVKDQVEKMAKDLEEANKEILALTENGGSAKATTFKQAVSEEIKSKHDDFLKFYESQKTIGSGSFEFVIKAPETVTTGNFTPTTAADVYAQQSVSGYSEYLYGNIFLDQYLDVGETELASIPFVDEVPGEGDFEIVAEGGLKPLIDVDFVIDYSRPRKAAGAMKATEEVLSDVKWMESAMTGTLKKKHDNFKQGDVLAALTGFATPFNATILGGVKVTAPQYYDMMAALAAGVSNSSEGNYTINLILVNTLDNLKKQLTKDGDGNYVMPPFADANGNIISGVRVQAHPKVPIGTYIAGDMRNVKVRNLWGYTVRFGWENDDIRRNLITMIGESRYHIYCTTNDKRGIITGTFADLETALT